jgi:hypothetical protein
MGENMKRILIFCLVLITSLTLFTSISLAQVPIQLGLGFTGNLSLGEDNFIFGPNIDFTAFPLTFEKDGAVFSTGFGISTGALFGFQNADEDSYAVLIPIQGHLHLDTHLDEELITNFFFSFQFKTGILIGISQEAGTNTGFILSGGGGLKYFFSESVGFNLLVEYGFLLLDNIVSQSVKFTLGLSFRF